MGSIAGYSAHAVICRSICAKAGQDQVAFFHAQRRGNADLPDGKKYTGQMENAALIEDEDYEEICYSI